MKTNIMMPNRNIVRIAALTVLILLVPLVAMQFTDEVNWGAEDFAAGAVLLIGVGLIFAAAARKIGDARYRVYVGVGLLAVLLLVWAQLAVGIFGD